MSAVDAFLYAIILVSSPFVVFWLGDGLVRWCSGMGKSYRTALSPLRAEPEVSAVPASIAFAGAVQ